MSDLFSQPETRSQEFWQALVALGGKPEDIARHMPCLTEAEIARKMAQARGQMATGPEPEDMEPEKMGSEKMGSESREAAGDAQTRKDWCLLLRPDDSCLQSNWGRRIAGKRK